MEQELTPVLLGADLNCYSLARAFFEAYGISSVAFGREVLGATRASRYLHFTAVEGLSDPAVCLDILLRYAAAHPGKARMLLPCTDEYAAVLMENRKELAEQYIIPLPPVTAATLFDKTGFYRMAEAWGIPHPMTHALRALPSFAEIGGLGDTLGYPFIIKPSSSIDYWHHPFPGMEKVYLAHNVHEAASVLKSIFDSGYPGEVLTQKYIPGGDSAGYVLTLYLDRTGRTVARAAGRVLLEEHTPCGKGNYAGLITVPIPAVAGKLSAMLSSLGYRGFANFDLRRDPRDGIFYALELNLRLGRSNYFLTGGGMNPAVLLVEDYLHGTDLRPTDMQREQLFRTVPFRTLYRYTEDEGLASYARHLHESGEECSPLYAIDDLARNPSRLAYVTAHMQREASKFRRYCPRYR